MTSRKTRLALAAAVAAFSLPALASDPCSVCDDPLFPQLARYAPAMTLNGSSGLATVRSDPTFPEVSQVAPAATLRAYASTEPAVDPEDGTPNVHVALIPEVVTPAATEHLAAH